MRLIQIELIKLHRLANYVMLGIMLFFTASIAALIFYLVHSTAATSLNNPMINSWVVILEKTLNVIMSVFIIINIGKEYSDNTLKRSIIDGHTRDDFYTGKLLLAILTAAFVYLVFNLVLLLGGLSIGKLDTITGTYGVSFLVNPLIKFLAACITAVFITFVVRSVAMGLVAFFAWNVVEFMLEGAQQIIAGLQKTELHYCNYLPLNSMDKVLTSADVVDKPVLFVAVAYLLLMLLGSYWLFMKRDIK